MYNHNDIENDIVEHVNDYRPEYKVRSLFHPAKVFDTYEEAISCYEKWLSENDFDFLQMFEFDGNNWVEMQFEDENE